MRTVEYAICKAYYSIGEATETSYVMWLNEVLGAVSKWICDFDEAQFFTKEEIERIDIKSLITAENEKLTIVAVNFFDSTN
jgi:hypothetical protein